MPTPKVLIVGSGGREHAIAEALARSPQAPELVAAPGNPGIATLARCEPVAASDVDGLVRLAKDEQADLVVIGPEAPLVAGLADRLAAERIAAFGPLAAAAQLEGSKAFAKEVMASAGVPTAGWEEVETVASGLAAITSYPAVLKFDGLAAGKGVVIAQDEDEARNALSEMLEQRRFGAGVVVVEEFMEGEELSLFALCDGERAVPLVPAQDYKRIRDGDEGPNTGGMGAYSPVPNAPDPHELCEQIHQPVVDLLRERGTPFHGLLYAGLMLTGEGAKVVEFNVRFGDPETQVVLPRMTSDLLAALVATTRPGGLAGAEVSFSDRQAVTIVLASRGYPESSSSGDVIEGLDAVPDGVSVFHAGTALDASGQTVTAGGRVLAVTALGGSVAEAREAAYAGVAAISFDGMQHRADIALRAVPAA
ncbi:MAG: phosphoribosylamine--glycine ligase [Baekduia sp.]